MNGRSVMSPELIGILSVGVALAGLILLVASWVGESLRSLDARLDKVEQNQAVLLNRMGRVEHGVEILLNRTAPRVPVVAKSRKGANR